MSRKKKRKEQKTKTSTGKWLKKIKKKQKIDWSSAESVAKEG